MTRTHGFSRSQITGALLALTLIWLVIIWRLCSFM